MTISNQTIVNNGIYDSVGESSTELVLQPRYARDRIIRQARMTLILFAIFILSNLTILPPVLIIAIFSAMWGNTIPGIFYFYVVIWIQWLSIMFMFTRDLIRENGYKTFIFDRTQQKLIINTVTIFGGNAVKIIPFDWIEDARFEELKDDSISIDVFLIIKESQAKIKLSGFLCEEYFTADNQKLREEHEELTLQVRTVLGFSNQQILAQFRRNRSLPTQAELEQQRLATLAGLKTLAKDIFASKHTKQDRLEKLRKQTQQFPEDPKIWEEFALQLALQQKPIKAEIIHAYRQAQLLYLDREDIEKAEEIAHQCDLLLSLKTKK
jgi:hypothetical protein